MATSGLNYAIIGSGALGGYYGGRLAHAGADVHFLLHSDYDHVVEHGLIVKSTQHGDIALPNVNAYRDVGDMPRCDVVVVGLKSTSNALLPDLLPGVIKDDGVVLTLQNGLGPEDDAAAVVGAERVLGGLCFLCSNKVGPGHIEQQRFDHIKLGAFSQRGITDRMRQISADFEAGGVKAQCVDDLALARWQKLVWNVPYNGLSAVLGVDCTVLMRHAEPLVRDLMMEVVAATKAVIGADIAPAFVETMLDNTRNMDAYRPSMLIDRERGRPMEVEAIYGEPVRRAEAAGCDVPRVRVLYEQLKVLNVAGGFDRGEGHGLNPWVSR
ncbi:MAG: putative 2-dehydropantoate 2-reductase [Phycisphaeraceae bacterium]